MSSETKPIKVWGKGGPNPPKVNFVLEELGVPYEVVAIPLADIKKPDYLAINPNGRLPAIHDPNTGLTLWESGAIVEYLIERYDTTYRLSFAPGTAESYLAKQWLYFQTTGQGPYYGQAIWFKKYHPERVPSAVERYTKEINRVTSVLDGHLAQQKMDTNSDGPWLVGSKFSYADLAFYSWQALLPMTKLIEKDEYDVDNFPHVKQWLEKMASRQSVKAVMGSYESLK